MITLFNWHNEIFPMDNGMEHRFHLFILGNKITLPTDMQHFKGSNWGYFDLDNFQIDESAM
jgi:hypothetical protein